MRNVNTYSSRGQDLWLLKNVFDYKEEGLFIDVGAGDGITFSNTYLMEKCYRWYGICVEPHVYLYIELCRSRHSRCENVCILNDNTDVDFIERGNKRYLSGIVGDYADTRILSQVDKGHPVKKKPAVPLWDLLDKHRFSTEIDYLSIDTEGSEYEILKDFPFDRYHFTAISVEVNHSQEETEPRYKEKRELVTRLLKFVGYNHAANFGADAIFLEEKTWKKLNELGLILSC